MKVVYLHQYFNTRKMHGGTRSFEIARRLVRFGHEVHVVTSWREKTTERGWFKTDEAGINVHWLPNAYSNRMGHARRIVAFVRFAVLAAQKTHAVRGDVIFATSTPLTIALPAIWAARRSSTPYVLEVRDLWPEVPIALGALRNPFTRYAARLLERFAYRNAQHIVALSPDMAQGIAQSGYPRHRINVVTNSADLDVFEPSESRAATFREAHPELGNRPIVLYAGTLGRVNDVGYAVDLARACKDRGLDASFVIIGDGAEAERIRSLADEVSVLNSNFFLYPWMTKEKISDAFSAAAIVASFVADVSVLWANSANKFFDGLASGSPVMINYGGWQAELLEENDIGFRVDRNPALAAAQLEARLGDLDWLLAAGQRARSVAEKMFSRESHAITVDGILWSATLNRKTGAGEK